MERKKKRRTRSRENILTFLNNLKSLGVPLRVTLIPKDEEFKSKHIPYIYTDIQNVPIRKVDSEENWGLLVFINEFVFDCPVLDNNRPYCNRKSVLDKIEKEIRDSIPEEYRVNYERWKKLDDILKDPDPPTEVPD